MKKLISLFTILFFSIQANSQLLLDEDFEGTTFPPLNWTSYDQDGNTVHPSVSSFLSGSWERSLVSSSNHSAVSTAYYDPSGTSDDWLVSPALIIPQASANNNTVLSYFTISFTTATLTKLSTYELRASTTGNAVADFTNILSVTQDTLAGRWQYQTVDLSSFAGDTIYLAWRNVSNNAYVIAVDDIIVETLPNDSISIEELLIEDGVIDQEEVEIKGVITNRGGKELNSFEVSWSENGGVPHKDTIDGLTVGPYIRAEFTHKVKWTASNPGAYTTIKAVVSNPNGNTLPAQDSINKNVLTILGNTVPKNVLLEHFTTARTQFAPDGQVVVSAAKDTLESIIPISIHSCFTTDGMTNQEALDYCNTLGNFSSPSAMIDRVLFEGEPDVAFTRSPLSGSTVSAWISRSIDRKEEGAPAEIQMYGSFNDSTRLLTVNVLTSFVDYVTQGDIRLSLMIIEDSVVGGGAEYDQANFYDTQAGHPYFGAGNPIINYNHRHVLRDVLPSSWGDSIVIPDTVEINKAYNKEFTYTLDSSWDASQVSVVAVVSYYGATDLTAYEVLNAQEISLKELDSAKSPCMASYTIRKDTSTTFNVILTNTSSNESTHTYFWEFGDGTTATGRTPSHSYQNFGLYEVCLTVSDSILNCSSTFCDTVGMDSLGNLKAGFSVSVEDQIIVGIDEQKSSKAEFYVYPNPAKSQVNIDLRELKDKIDVTIHDLSGRVLFQKEKLSGGIIETINLTSFAKGIYFIKVNHGKNQELKKLIIR